MYFVFIVCRKKCKHTGDFVSKRPSDHIVPMIRKTGNYIISHMYCFIEPCPIERIDKPVENANLRNVNSSQYILHTYIVEYICSPLISICVQAYQYHDAQ